MRILLVDDDENKAREIGAFVSDAYGPDSLVVRRSYQSGLREILLEKPDLVLLDMTMPNYDVSAREPGGRERRYAGREILRQIERRQIAVPVVVITQYEQFEEDGREFTLAELVATLRQLFPTCFVGAIYYQAGNTAWMTELREYLTR